MRSGRIRSSSSAARSSGPTRVLLLGDQVYADEVSAGDARVHPAQARHRRRARRADRRLRGVHAALPRVVVGPGHPLAALDRADDDDLRRPRRARRLEHLVALGRGDATEAVVGRAHHRRVHVVLDLPAPREPLSARARRGDDLAARSGRGGRRPAAAGARATVGPGVGSKPLGVLPRLRRHTPARARLAGSPRALGRTPSDDRRRRVGLDRRALGGRVRPPRDREHLAGVPADRDPPPPVVERGALRRPLGRPGREPERAAAARGRPRALGGLQPIVRAAVRLVAGRSHAEARRLGRPRRSCCSAATCTGARSARSSSVPAAVPACTSSSAPRTATRCRRRSDGSSGPPALGSASGSSGRWRGSPACRRPRRRGGRSGQATFENSLGELFLDGRAATATLRRSPQEGEDPERLVADRPIELAR